MIKIEAGTKLITTTEVLENVADYIDTAVPTKEQGDIIKMLGKYLGAAVGEDEDYIRGYMRIAMQSRR